MALRLRDEFGALLFIRHVDHQFTLLMYAQVRFSSTSGTAPSSRSPDPSLPTAARRHPSDRPAIECCHHFAAFNRCKSKQISATLCRHRGAPRINEKVLQHNNFR
jgi:hypothetical protein